jgi:lycopene cyclase domain-containing protein
MKRLRATVLRQGSAKPARAYSGAMDRFQYMILMGLCLIGTLPLEFAFEARVWRRPRRLAVALVPSLSLFLAWDVWATARGTWSFSPRYTVGITLPGGVAVEELAFFIVVPVCALLTLEAVRNIAAGRVTWLRTPGRHGG